MQRLLLFAGNVLPLGLLNRRGPLVVVPHLLGESQDLCGLLRGGRKVGPVLLLVLAVPGGGIPAELCGGSLLLGRQILVPVVLDVGPLLGVPLLFGPAQGLGGLFGLEGKLGPGEVQEASLLESLLHNERRILGYWHH